MEEPRIRVGICDGYPEIRGRLNALYRAGGSPFTGEFVCYLPIVLRNTAP